MMISRLILKNWKNFQSVDVPLSARTVIMGPNGIGKSNLLDALRFLADIARPDGGLSFALHARGGLEKIKFAAAKKKELVELEIHLADSLLIGTYYRYSLGITSGPSGSPLLAYERIRKSGERILDRPDKKDVENSDFLAQTRLETVLSGISSDSIDLKEIAYFLGSISYLNFHPMLLRHQFPFPPADIPGDPFGRKILQRVAEMPEDKRENKIRVIEDTLKMAMPQMPKLRFSLGKSARPDLEGTFDIGRPRVKFQTDKMSDGTLAAFAILWSFLEDGPLMLLENPEAYLNPETIHQMCYILYIGSALGRKKQIIMSTHSSEFLKDKITPITAKEIILLAAGSYKEGTLAVSASSVPAMVDDMESGMSADEVVMEYAGSLDLMEGLSEFMGLNLDFTDKMRRAK